MSDRQAQPGDKKSEGKADQPRTNRIAAAGVTIGSAAIAAAVLFARKR